MVLYAIFSKALKFLFYFSHNLKSTKYPKIKKNDIRVHDVVLVARASDGIFPSTHAPSLQSAINLNANLKQQNRWV